MYEGQRSRPQGDTRWKCLFSNFSVIYDHIVFKLSWLIVLEKETTWCKFQGRRLKVKVTQRQHWKIYCTLIFEWISVKFGWYIGNISSINRMNFQVRMPNVMVQWDKIIAQYTLHTSVHRDNKPRPVHYVSLDVSTKNSVDGPSQATMQREGRPPCRVSLQVQF